jgi:hypothetical protein
MIEKFDAHKSANRLESFTELVVGGARSGIPGWMIVRHHTGKGGPTNERSEHFPWVDLDAGKRASGDFDLINHPPSDVEGQDHEDFLLKRAKSTAESIVDLFWAANHRDAGYAGFERAATQLKAGYDSRS